MRQIGEMPNLVDPTAPREVIDWNTDPRHPEVFAALAPLPPSTPLKALINVQKQRRIAAVIQSLVAGQHLAARVQYAVDRKVYQRCLKIRALSYDELQNAVDAQGL
jgi:GDP/GTP exchange factor required for growth at low temperature